MSGRTRTEKLGVKPGLRVAVMGVKDKAFLAELREAGAKVAPPPVRGPTRWSWSGSARCRIFLSFSTRKNVSSEAA